MNWFGKILGFSHPKTKLDLRKKSAKEKKMMFKNLTKENNFSQMKHFVK